MRIGLSPLRAFVRDTRRAHDRASVVLAAVMVLYALVPLSLLAAPQLALPLMARFHLRTESFAAWALLQPSPWMYNFENYYLVSDEPLTRDELEAPSTGLRWQAINHQNARVITFADMRAKLLQSSGKRYYYLSSRYREYHLLTAYRVSVFDAPGPHARPALVDWMAVH